MNRRNISSYRQAIFITLIVAFCAASYQYDTISPDGFGRPIVSATGYYLGRAQAIDKYVHPSCKVDSLTCHILMVYSRSDDDASSITDSFAVRCNMVMNWVQPARATYCKLAAGYQAAASAIGVLLHFF